MEYYGGDYYNRGYLTGAFWGFLNRGFHIPAARKHYLEPYRGCRMAPQQVKFRLPQSTRDYTIPIIFEVFVIFWFYKEL